MARHDRNAGQHAAESAAFSRGLAQFGKRKAGKWRPQWRVPADGQPPATRLSIASKAAAALSRLAPHWKAAPGPLWSRGRAVSSRPDFDQQR